MTDRSGLIAAACAAMMDGDLRECERLLERFSASVTRRPLSDEERPTCERQLTRLRQLAEAACGGIDDARAWLADLVQATGGLDVYGRNGRHRVSTELTGTPTRF